MAQFQLEQFHDAAESLSGATTRNPDDQWALAILVATCGYLDRKEEAALAIAQDDAVAARLGRLPLTIWQNNMSGVWVAEMLPVPLSVQADRQRFAKGLRLAGVPGYLTKDTFGERNKLTGAELRSLVFGHQLRGHDYGFGPGNDRFASISAEGVATFSGSWGHWKDAAALIEEDKLCISAQFYSTCFDAYRYPGGTRTRLDEYVLLGAQGAFLFSLVD